MSTGAVTGGGDPRGRRQLLRVMGAGVAAAALAGYSVIRMIGGPGTATGSATPTTRPTVLATAVPLLGALDITTVDAAVGFLVDTTDRLYALTLQRPDLFEQLTTTTTAHEAHLHALAALAGTPVPAHAQLDPTRAPVPSATPSTAPTTRSFLASAASIERTLAGVLTTQTARAVDPDVATLLASVAASATAWQAWFEAASTAARPESGG